LWDNFLQLYETDEIILLGVGNAYLGVKVLLINRGETSLNLGNPYQ
jgi:histone deacetylase 6